MTYNNETFGKPVSFPIHSLTSDYYARSIQRCRKNFIETGNFFNPNITNENFPISNNLLLHNGAYQAHLIPLLKPTTTMICQKFLESQKNLLTGVYGLALFWENHAMNIPSRTWIMSLAHKSGLWNDGEDFRVPCLYRKASDIWKFDLGLHRKPWAPNVMMLALSRLN